MSDLLGKPEDRFSHDKKQNCLWPKSQIGLHYEITSVQYEAISKSGKNDFFRCKNVIFFLIFAQNIDCGYTLEPPQ